MKKRLTPDEQTWVNMRDSLRTLKAKVRSLERQNARLLTEDYQLVAEREIAMLTERVELITQRWEEAEAEVLQLRRQIRSVA